MRIVLDTSVIVAAFRSSIGASRELLRLIAQRQIRLVASSALYLEYEAVLTRHEQIAAHGVPPHDVLRLLLDAASFTDHVHIYFNYRPQLRDSNDEMVLEAAVNGHANAIVTHNLKDFLPAASHFGTEVLTPASIIKQRFKS